MSATQNTINQAKGLVESLLQLEENFSHLSKINLEMQKNLKEADANLNALQGENTGLQKVINDLTRRVDEEVRKNARLEMTLLQLAGTVERARDDLTQTVNEVPKAMHLKDMVGPGAGITEEKKGYTPNTAPQPPFYGVHIENGETVIYPPQQCQTPHQLSQFYRLAGLVISQDILMERGGVHLRGLSGKHKARLKEHYKLKFPDDIVKSFGPPERQMG